MLVTCCLPKVGVKGPTVQLEVITVHELICCDGKLLVPNSGLGGDYHFQLRMIGDIVFKPLAFY